MKARTTPPLHSPPIPKPKNGSFKKRNLPC